MDTILKFFTETLTGPWYIVYVVVLVILIFACIGYLSERAIYLKKKNAKYATAEEPSSPVVNGEVMNPPLEPVNTEMITKENMESISSNPSLPQQMETPVVEPVSVEPTEPVLPDAIGVSVPLVEEPLAPQTIDAPLEEVALEMEEPSAPLPTPVIPTIEMGSDLTPSDASSAVSFPSNEETVKIPGVVEASSAPVSQDLPK